MARFFKITTLSICFIIGLSSILQPQTVKPKFDTFPASITHAFHQDSLGFIWIGTQEGLLRYDGYTFKHYNHIPFDSTSISNDWVFDIAKDSSGNLWIATFGGGLNYFDQQTELFTRYSGSAENNQNNYITKIIVNDDGSLWFTSMAHGLTHFKQDEIGKPEYTHYKFSDEPITKSFPTKCSALTMHKDKQGIIWIGTAKEGLIRFNPLTQDKKQYKHDPDNPHSISHNTISSICEDDSGNIWIGTGHPNVSQHGGGLNMYDRKTDEFKHFTHDWSGKYSICSNNISSLLIDQTGTMWIGTWNNYINTVPLKELIADKEPFFQHLNNLNESVIETLFEDRLGNIWIGLMAMQSHKFDRQQNSFALFSRNANYPNSLTQTGTWTVYADRFGSIWFGTDGIDIYNPSTGNFKHLYHDGKATSGLSENMISGIQEDPEGNVWIATWHNGIDILNPQNVFFKHLRHDPNVSLGLGSNSIQFILARTNGDFWIASHDVGIQLYERKTGNFYTYNLDPKTNEDFLVSSLCEDRRGVLWIGTFNSGIYSLYIDEHKNPEIFHYYNDPQNLSSLSCNDISDIIQPSIIDTTALWIATKAGLNRFDLETKIFTHFFRKDGMSSNFILKILEDNQGNLWCSTTNNLSVYKIKTGKILNYGKGDGVPLASFGGFRQNAGKDLAGHLYFAGGKGVLSFFPDQLTVNPNIPPIVFTDFKIFQKSAELDTAIQFKKSLTLSHHQNAFSFEFAALNFTNPEKNQYAYKIEGLYDNWIYIGNERTASFTNLDPGEYVFRVKGSNNHGIWNEQGAAIKIIITPPWWQSTPFRVSISLLVVLAIVVAYKLRVRHHKEARKSQERFSQKLLESQEEERQRIASELHDSLGQNLLMISNEIQQALQAARLRKKDYRGIFSLVKESIQETRTISQNLHPHLLNRLGLTRALQAIIEKMSHSSGIEFEAYIDEIGELLPKKLEIHLYRFVQEALNNIVRHSGTGRAVVRIQRRQQEIRVYIRDYGKGIAAITEKTKTGIGLSVMQSRADILGAELHISSKPDRGTAVKLNIPPQQLKPGEGQ